MGLTNNNSLINVLKVFLRFKKGDARNKYEKILSVNFKYCLLFSLTPSEN